MPTPASDSDVDAGVLGRITDGSTPASTRPSRTNRNKPTGLLAGAPKAAEDFRAVGGDWEKRGGDLPGAPAEPEAEPEADGLASPRPLNPDELLRFGPLILYRR
mmetsp:Transcript_49767/g.98078  ORF Transcript_49767/g.98078 Transcript_49767/m.98078 type:complete len:104 (-) Transcript_49767:191-502(-)